jgi:hypothetical protein
LGAAVPGGDPAATPGSARRRPIAIDADGECDIPVPLAPATGPDPGSGVVVLRPGLFEGSLR